MKTALGVFSVAVVGVAWILMLVGLGFFVGGARVVVSNRLDERLRASKSLKTGIRLLAIGGLLFVAARWLAEWLESV